MKRRDVALARARSELAARAADDVERREHLARIGRQRLAVAHRRDRLRRAPRRARARRPGLVELEIAGPAAAREQLGDDAIVDAGVLPQIERREVKAEHVDAAEHVAQVLLGDVREARRAQRCDRARARSRAVAARRRRSRARA